MVQMWDWNVLTFGLQPESDDPEEMDVFEIT
jgi:hypothetical protein